MSELPVPPELGALITAERVAKVASAAERVAVRAKLAASVGAAPLGSAVVGASLTGAGKAIAILAITLAAGGGAALALRDEGSSTPSTRAPTYAIAATTRATPAEIVLPPAAAADSIVITTLTEPVTVETPAPDLGSASMPRLRVPSVPFAPRADSRTAIEDPGTSLPEASEPSSARWNSAPSAVLSQPLAPSALPSVPEGVAAAPAPESSLLAQAWSALTRRDAARALVLVRDGERAYPGGPLSEERDAIRISALSQLNRRDETRSAAARFLSSYPHSIHRPLVQRALEEAP